MREVLRIRAHFNLVEREKYFSFCVRKVVSSVKTLLNVLLYTNLQKFPSLSSRKVFESLNGSIKGFVPFS